MTTDKMTDPKQKLALLGETDHWQPPMLRYQHLQPFSGPDAIAADNEIDAFLLAGRTADEQLALARQLRSDAHFACHPLYLVQRDAPTGELALLCDGLWLAPDEMARQIDSWQQRCSLFTLQHPDAAMQLLLGWLWTREEGRLLPLRDWQRPDMHFFPLLECLAGNADAARLLLQQALGMGLIELGNLHDRLRSCPTCASTHLNYIDLCPACHGHDIQQENAIHCFNCGHVAPQSRFRQHGLLSCPNCQTRLRHIGSDYDRPMENYQCRSCSELFIEPEVRARCVACGSEHAPEELRTLAVSDYVLSERGRQLCRHGDVLGAVQAFHLVGGLVSPELFRFNLAWLDRLCARYPEQPYSLLAFRLGNVPGLIERHGYQATMLQLERLQQSLQSQIRTTDLTTLLGEELYLLLLPNTPADGVERLKQKINAVMQQGAEHGKALALLMFSYSSTPGRHQQQDTEALIDALCNEVSP